MEGNFEKPKIENHKEWRNLELDTENIFSEEISEIAGHYLEEKISDYSDFLKTEKISLQERLVLIEKNDINLIGADTFEIKFEITENKKDFFELYKKTISEKIPEINLRTGVLYMVYKWKPEFQLFGENGEDLGFGTPSIIDRSY